MKNPALYNILTLAHVGDAVFALKVRTRFALCGDLKSGAVHAASSKKYLSAKAQAAIFDELSPLLNEVEAEIARRAKNAKTVNTAKNATAEEYHKATAIEAVMGYLHLSGQNERLNELFNLILVD